ncbi:MAG TPA: tetratricopeptide repeat protein [Thermoanaerobaculia bacterium]|jgi:tetratricopeptide (TPR) repeat protein|nr:tetratricopeptide repeat protein [Thermoanaerobaculia bacterium]
MSEHPTATELEGLVRGDLSREQARLVVRHLLRGCESCVAQIAPYASMLLAAPAAATRHAELDARASAASSLADAPGDAPGAAKVRRSASSPRSGRRIASPAGAPAASEGAAAAPALASAPVPSAALAEPDRTLLEHAYDRAIDRAFAAVMRHGEKAARSGAMAGKALAQLTAAQIEGLRELPADLRGFAGYEALLDRSWAMRREDPKQMVKLAELAVEAAASLGAEGFSAGQVEDFQARAAIELANAYRVMDRLEEAQAGFEAARRHYREGSQDRLLGARLLEVEANIHGDRGELGEALAALDRALRVYRRHGDPHLAGRSLIKKGLYTARAGRQQEAIELLTEGLAMIDPAQDGPLVLAAVHNTACCLMEGGRCREARSLLWRHLSLYEQHAGRQDRLKLRWLQAQIYAGLGDHGRAERAFEEVRLGLREAGKSHSEAMATVELAGLRLRQGREDAARGLAVEAAELVLGLDISREVSAALAVQKARLEKTAVVTPELVGQILQLLRDTAPEERTSLLVRSA